MKKCECGFSYNKREDLEMVNLIQAEGVINYYCPDCKSLKDSESVNAYKLNDDVKIEFVEGIYAYKKDVLWYGGLVCKVIYKDLTFSIIANGDVRGVIYKDGNELTTFKDKSNNGNFYHVVNSYLPEIKTDEQLQLLLNSDLSFAEIQDKKLTAIVLDNNNWWEALVYKNNNKFIDSFTIDISDNIDECIDYIINEKDNLYAHFSEYLD